MSRAVSVILGIQIVFAALFFVPASMADSSAGLGLLALYFYYSVFAAPLAVFGLFVLWRYPLQRSKAAIIVLLPVAAVLLPSLVQWLLGGPISEKQFVGLLILLAIAAAAASIVAPKKVAAVVPNALFRSRTLNGLIVAALLLAWVVTIVAGLLLVNDATTTYQRDTGMGLAYAIILAAMVLLAIAAGSVVTLVWASLGLRSDVDGACRKLNITQAVIALPGILIGGLVLVVLIGQS